MHSGAFSSSLEVSTMGTPPRWLDGPRTLPRAAIVSFEGILSPSVPLSAAAVAEEGLGPGPPAGADADAVAARGVACSCCSSQELWGVPDARSSEPSPGPVGVT